MTTETSIGSFAIAAMVGGASSEITGGKLKNGAATAAFTWALSQGANKLADQSNDRQNFDDMSKEEKVAWVQANADDLGLDFSNVDDINLDYAEQYVEGWDRYGVPITCEQASCSREIGGAYRDGTVYLYRTSFEGGSRWIYRDIQVSKGFAQGANALTVTYTPMEQVVHALGHEVAHSHGIDVSGKYQVHPNAEKAGLEAVRKFRGMWE